MGKKKSANTKPDNRVVVIVLKDTPAYREWFNALSEETLIDAATMTRDALAKWAYDRALPPPPSGPTRPRRKKTN